MSGEVNVRWCEFLPDGGGRRECFCSVEAAAGAFPDFASEFAAVWSAYNAELAAKGMTPEEEMLLRFHLSDAANQESRLRGVLGGRPASITEQPPAAGTRVSLEAWILFWKERCVRVVYSPTVTVGDSEAQMHQLFRNLARTMDSEKGTLDRNVLRTWIYCRDVDNNYAGVVRGRNRCFDEHKMTERFLASTGIGGGAADPHQLVAMDALVCRAEKPEQTPLRALENLSPTSLYGVRFERGMRIGWRDRDWLLVSGTASIDKHGKVLYAGDVGAQSRRVIENISALLAEGNATLADVRAATVYLRDPAELPAAKAVFDAAFPEIPLVYLRAPVCRPAWLVECECIAVRSTRNPNSPQL